jgi:hypothetical protein
LSPFDIVLISSFQVSDCLEVYDVVYQTDLSKIFDTKPVSLASQSVSNYSDTPQTMTIQITQSYNTTSSWSQTDGITVGAKTSFQTGIPFIAEGKIEISASETHSWTSGTSETTTQTFTASVPVTCPAKSKISSRVTFHQSKMDIPWRAKAAWRAVTDQTSVTDIGGTWDGTTVYDVQYTIDAPQPLEDSN